MAALFQSFFKKVSKKLLQFLKIYDIIAKPSKSGPLVKRLRHRPLTAKTGVRFPQGSPKQTYPNYFVTNKVFGFVFYMNLEAENA